MNPTGNQPCTEQRKKNHVRRTVAKLRRYYKPAHWPSTWGPAIGQLCVCAHVQGFLLKWQPSEKETGHNALVIRAISLVAENGLVSKQRRSPQLASTSLTPRRVTQRYLALAFIIGLVFSSPQPFKEANYTAPLTCVRFDEAFRLWRTSLII